MSGYRVLVVDDDAGLRLSVASALAEAGYATDQAVDGEEAVTKVQAGKYDLVLLDVNMPRMNGMEALKEIKAHDPSIVVIMLTAFSNVRDAVAATKEGAYNYLEKPVKAENLAYMAERALKARHMVRSMSYSAPVIRLPSGTEFVGQSNEMKRVFGVIEKLARVDTAVFIRGESGTGKELVAKALHFNGPRKDNRFVSINCSAIPENLIESELFGHEKGAFTGADMRKIGKFQYADGGTLFLDEIGDISAAMQVKLLRVLQDKKFMPVGSNREIEVNVRIVAATNRNLEEMIRTGVFREDLYYRLNVLPINLPPLRERKNDIEALVTYFVERFNQQYHKQVRGISPDAMRAFKNHAWPGNIRELENVVEHAFVLEASDELSLESLPAAFPRDLSEPAVVVDVAAPAARVAAPRSVSAPNLAVSNLNAADDLDGDENLEGGDGDDADLGAAASLDGAIAIQPGVIPTGLGERGFKLDIHKLDFQANKEEFEKQFLISALKAFNGRINQTALHANIPKKTLLRKLEKYGIRARDYSS